MGAQVVISLLILLFVVCGVVYDVYLSPQGRELHSRRYRWRRLQNWFPMGVAYAAFYMARYNVAAGNVSAVRDQLGFSAAFMGWVLSAGSWSYAASGPLTGQFTDRVGGKNGMILACLGAAVCNLSLGLLFLCNLPLIVQKALFMFFYASNVLVQGFGTSAVVKINASWYAPSERGMFAGVFNIMLTSGYFLALGTGSTIIDSLGWAFVFVIPGMMLLAMGLTISHFVKNRPADTNSLSENELKNSPSRANMSSKTAAGEDGKVKAAGLTPKEQMKQLMKNPTFLGYLTAVFFLCWARDGFLNWFLSFFDAVREHPLTADETAIIGGAWTMGGFVGGILCGWLSDVIFHGDRVKPIFVFSILQAFMLGLLYFVSASCSVPVLGLLIFLSSVFLLGNYTLLSYTVPSDLPREIAAGASGIMTAVGYFSTGLSGVVMGNIVGGGGYFVWAISLMSASVLAGVFTLLGSYFSGKGEKKSTKQQPAVVNPTPTKDSDENGTYCSESVIQVEEDVVVVVLPPPASQEAASTA